MPARSLTVKTALSTRLTDSLPLITHICSVMKATGHFCIFLYKLFFNENVFKNEGFLILTGTEGQNEVFGLRGRRFFYKPDIQLPVQSEAHENSVISMQYCPFFFKHA